MIPLGLLLFPIVEIATCLYVIRAFGFGNAFFIWLLSTILGIGLFRATSAQLSMGVAQALRRGESPGQGAVEGALVGLAGLLFLVPGYVSDIFGLIVLFRPVRRMIARRLLAKIPSVHVSAGHVNTGEFTAGGVTMERPQRPAHSQHKTEDGAAGMVIDVDATKVE